MSYKLIIYKYRFFFGYVIIGLLSLVIEFLIYNFLNDFHDDQTINSFLSVLVGIVFSFWLNVRYNFKISKSKRNKALIYFVLISIFSYLVQILIINRFNNYYNYEILRTITSGSIFWVSYAFHRIYSFFNLWW